MCQKHENIDTLASTKYGTIVRCNSAERIQLIFNSVLLYYPQEDFPLVIDYVLNLDINDQCCHWFSQNRIVIQLARNGSMCIFTFEEFSVLKHMLTEAYEFMAYEEELDRILDEI